MTQFRYVEFWSPGMSSWHRIERENALPYCLEVDGKETFCSAQFYQRPTRREGEDHGGHPWFDFDCKEDPGKAIAEARALIEWFQDLGLTEPDIRCFFSGGKGAHVYLSGYTLGCVPSPHFTEIMHLGAEMMKESLQLGTLDLSVYGARHLMRVPGSMHPSGRRCSEIDLKTWEVKEITTPRPQLRWDFLGERDPVPWWPGLVEAHESHRDYQRTHAKVEFHRGTAHDLPDCLADLLRRGLWATSSRNKVSMQLSLGLRAVGIEEGEAERVAGEWARNLSEQYTGTRERERIRAAVANVHWAYHTDKVGFLCEPAMKGIGAACPGRERCRFVKSVKDNGGAAKVSLSETIQVKFAGQLLAFEGIPVAVEQVPLMLPRSFDLRCSPEEKLPCTKCKYKEASGGTWQVATEKILTMAIQANEQAQLGYAEKAMQIPDSCPGHKVFVRDRVNLLAMLVQPNTRGDDPEGGRENQVYLTSHFLDDQKPYLFEGVTIMHPRTYRAVQMCHKSEALRGGVDEFHMTKEIQRDLEAFQGEQAEEKLNAIHKEWENHVHRIYGRRLASLGIALSWFSQTSFHFQGNLYKRGWIEALCMGDTAQGKSEMALRFMDWFGCGSIVSGENLSFAGLVAGIDRIDGRHVSRKGAFARNDRGLVVLDEFGAVDPELIGKLSDVRTRGEGQLDKIIHRVFPARCRKIFNANPVWPGSRRSCTMDDIVAFPVMHILQLMPNPEDVRRLDYLIGFRSSRDIARLIHEIKPELDDQRYNERRSRNLVRWAWSRKASQIAFLDGAEDACIESAKYMSERYTNSVRLCDPGDMRYKIAKIAVAIATHLFSTDETGAMVLVKPIHVDATQRFLRSLYDSPDLQYDMYSDSDATSEDFDHKTFVTMGMEFMAKCGSDMMSLAEIAPWKKVIKVLLSQRFFTAGDLIDMTGVMNGKMLVGSMVQNGLLNKGARGYYATKKGIKFSKLIHTWIQDGGGNPLVDATEQWFEKRKRSV